jgi:Do/DeqQ family serine protease
VRPALFGIFVLVTNPTAARDASTVPPASLSPMLHRVIESVVSISVKGTAVEEVNPLLADPFLRRFFGLPEPIGPIERPFQATGSGVVVDAGRGFLLTNSHLVVDADEITVTFADRTMMPASIVGLDPETDIALIAVEPGQLKAIDMGSSADIKVGDFVVAVGNPFGLGQTVTFGIISGLGRSGLGIEGYEDFIQTDAAINPGNSGGALVDMSGRLVGINSALIAPSGGNVGIGFAIPSDLANQVMRQLIAYGRVRRGRLGIAIQELTPDLAIALGVAVREGVVVSQVTLDSAAARAGLDVGDVIVGVDGFAVRSVAELRKRIGVREAGETIRLAVARAEQTLSISAELTELASSAEPPEELTGLLTGIVLGETLALPLDVEATLGVRITAVAPDSAAAAAGLEVGDFILAVDRQQIVSARDIIERVAGRKSVLLTVYRTGNIQLVPLKG